ncbi:MAG: hypothetical protein ACJAWL_003751 [Motiliproteus sp.]|jgi:hypothetical protein
MSPMPQEMPTGGLPVICRVEVSAATAGLDKLFMRGL